MKIKLQEIISQTENIKSLLQNKLPVKIAYRLNKLSGKIDHELKTYTETKNGLVIEYGEKQENGDIKVTDPEKLVEFHTKHNELIEMDVELDFEKLKIEDLGDITLSPNEIIPFIFE